MPLPCGLQAVAPRDMSSAKPTELGFDAANDSTHTHDIHHDPSSPWAGPRASDLCFQGRDFRLTDVHGQLIHKLYA